LGSKPRADSPKWTLLMAEVKGLDAKGSDPDEEEVDPLLGGGF
jgi:hypothetical protein